MGTVDAWAKHVKLPQVYMFGFSASFTDSIVYFTDVHAVDSAWIDDSNGFLDGRSIYSNQLKDYLADELQMPNRVCIVMYGTTREDVEKEFLKMKRLYTVKAKDMYDVRYLNTQEFRFRKLDINFAEEED
ncbi:MAG: hypothetical protein IJ527_07925 [Prevotella sp.]|nr:hypothetical protein [Prevotella sp.]